MRIRKYKENVLPTQQTSRTTSLPGEKIRPQPIPTPPKAVDPSAKYNAMQEFAETVTKIGQKIDEGIALNEYNNGILEAERQLSALKTDIEQNPIYKQMDPDETLTVFEERSKEIYDNVSNNIKHNKAKEKFSLDYEASKIKSKAWVQSKAWQYSVDKQTDDYNAQMMEFERLGGTAKEYSTQSEYILKGFNRIDQAAKSGIETDPETAKKRFANNIEFNYYNQKILDEVIEGQAWKKSHEILEEQIENNPHLEAAHKIRLKKTLYSAFEQRKNDEEKVDAFVRYQTTEQMKDSIASVAITGKEIPGTRQMVAAIGKKELSQYDKGIAWAQKTYQVGENLKSASVQKMGEILQSLKPKAGTKDFGEQYELYENAKKMVTARVETLVEDPAAYVLSQSNVGQQAITDDMTFEQQNAVTRNNVDMVVSEQKRLGVTDEFIKVLPTSQAERMAYQINNMSGEDTADFMATLELKYGKYYDKVYEQLVEAGLDHNSQILTSMNTPQEATVRAELSEALKMEEKDIKEALGSQSATANTDIKQTIDSELAPWVETVISAGTNRNNITAIKNMKEAVRKLALSYTINENMDPDEAAERAAEKVLLNKYHPIRDTYRVPRQFNQVIVEDNISAYMDAIEENPTLLSTEFQPETVVNNILSNGYWVTNEKETGVVLMTEVGIHGGGYIPVRNRDGKRVELLFNEMKEQVEPNYFQNRNDIPQNVRDILEEDFG